MKAKRIFASAGMMAALVVLPLAAQWRGSDTACVSDHRLPESLDARTADLARGEAVIAVINEEKGFRHVQRNAPRQIRAHLADANGRG